MKFVSAIMLASALASVAYAQSNEVEGDPRIIEMANIFARGFFEGDQEAPQSVIHPEISKIGVMPNYRGSGRDVTEELTPGKLWEIALTLNGAGTVDPADVTVGVEFFDQTGTVSVIRLDAHTWWYDFFLATRINGEWVFVNCAYAGQNFLQNQNPEADTSDITTVAQRYIAGYYSGDFDLVESAIWPDFDRRHVVRGGRHEYLQPETLETLRFEIAGHADANRFEGVDAADVSVIGLTERTSAVRIDADGWTEWLFLQRLNGEWLIVNSFWEAV